MPKSDHTFLPCLEAPMASVCRGKLSVLTRLDETPVSGTRSTTLALIPTVSAALAYHPPASPASLRFLNKPRHCRLGAFALPAPISRTAHSPSLYVADFLTFSSQLTHFPSKAKSSSVLLLCCQLNYINLFPSLRSNCVYLKRSHLFIHCHSLPEHRLDSYCCPSRHLAPSMGQNGGRCWVLGAEAPPVGHAAMAPWLSDVDPAQRGSSSEDCGTGSPVTPVFRTALVQSIDSKCRVHTSLQESSKHWPRKPAGMV